MPVNAFIASTNSSPIVEQTPREFLFGYDNAFIQVGNSLLPFWIKFQKIGILDRVIDDATYVTRDNKREFRIKKFTYLLFFTDLTFCIPTLKHQYV